MRFKEMYRGLKIEVLNRKEHAIWTWWNLRKICTRREGLCTRI